jgi:DNA-binding response OmpR family regulator
MQPALAWIVDDSPSCSRLLARRLGDAGAEVRAFSDAPPALAELDETGPGSLPGLIVLDGELPGCQGEDVARDLRRRGYPGVIALLSGSPRADESALRAAGIDAALVKPLTSGQAGRLIAAAARRVHRLAREVA